MARHARRQKATKETTRWILNRETGAIHAVGAEQAVYLLGQIDPGTLQHLYEEASEPKTTRAKVDRDAMDEDAAQADALRRRGAAPAEPDADPDPSVGIDPGVRSWGVPDAARGEVAGGNEGFTTREEAPVRAVIAGEDPTARQAEAKKAVLEGQEAAEKDARKKAAKRGDRAAAAVTANMGGQKPKGS